MMFNAAIMVSGDDAMSTVDGGTAAPCNRSAIVSHARARGRRGFSRHPRRQIQRFSEVRMPLQSDQRQRGRFRKRHQVSLAAPRDCRNSSRRRRNVHPSTLLLPYESGPAVCCSIPSRTLVSARRSRGRSVRPTIPGPWLPRPADPDRDSGPGAPNSFVRNSSRFQSASWISFEPSSHWMPF